MKKLLVFFKTRTGLGTIAAICAVIILGVFVLGADAHGFLGRATDSWSFGSGGTLSGSLRVHPERLPGSPPPKDSVEELYANDNGPPASGPGAGAASRSRVLPPSGDITGEVVINQPETNTAVERDKKTDNSPVPVNPGNPSDTGAKDEETGSETVPSGPAVTLSIDAETMGRGFIMKARAVSFTEGETVFEVLFRECKDSGIHMASRWTPIYNSYYIEAIDNLYEFDGGSASGWMYKVNGWYPNYGCSKYVLEDGDVIEWRYTCQLGYDIGGGYAAGG